MEVLARERRRPGRRQFLALAAAAWLELPVAWGQEDETPIPEYGVKAALIYKFLRFLTWPEKARPAAEAPFRIGVLGRDPFGEILDDTVKGKMVDDHPIQIVRSDALSDVLSCPVLFVCPSEKARLDAILEGVRGKAVLTLGDTDGFAERGVMINLELREKKVTFQITYAAARAVEIEIDAQLLKLAELVGSPEGQGAEG